MKNPRIEVEFRAMEQASAKGGVFAVKAFAGEFGPCERVKGEKAFDSRKQKGTRKGCDPAVYVASFLFGFAGGGAGMADFGRLNDEAGLKEIPGVKRFPDETTSGEWPRAIGREGSSALWRLNREFIAWALPEIVPGRLLRRRELELFFDDTQLEVTSKRFEGAGMNHDGNTTLSRQTLWAGPFLAAGELFWRYAFICRESSREQIAHRHGFAPSAVHEPGGP